MLFPFGIESMNSVSPGRPPLPGPKLDQRVDPPP
jgi:hypothetical protein